MTVDKKRFHQRDPFIDHFERKSRKPKSGWHDDDLTGEAPLQQQSRPCSLGSARYDHEAVQTVPLCVFGGKPGLPNGSTWNCNRAQTTLYSL
jgi:hypothetical protein